MHNLIFERLFFLILADISLLSSTTLKVIGDKRRGVRTGRPTNDGIAAGQDAVNYPIKQDPVWEEGGHDLPDETTKGSPWERVRETLAL